MRVALALCALLAVGCGQDETLAGGTRVELSFPATGVPSFGDVPFPSDVYLSGGAVTDIPGLERVATENDRLQAALSALDGFGRSTGGLFFVDGDVADIPEGSVFVADVDHGRTYPATAKWLPSLSCLTVLPLGGTVLPPGTRAAVVVTTSVRAADGTALAASETLQRIASGNRATPQEELYGAALDALVATGAVPDASAVAGLAPHTTSTRSNELFELADAVRADAEARSRELILADTEPYTSVVFGVHTSPSLDDWLGTPEKDGNGREWPGGDNPGGIAHDAIGAVASGALVSPSYMDPETRHFARDSAGNIVVADHDATIPVTVVIPKTPPPPAGYPVVVSGHGLSNHRGSMFSLANEYARAGFATVGIDDIAHGSRAGLPDKKNNFKGPYDGPDGLPDSTGLPLSFFAGFSDFVTIQDNFRQSVLDQVSLVALVRSSKLNLTALSSAADLSDIHLDPTRIVWSGGSLGGMMGTMTTAVEPHLSAAALQVPGASFVGLIATDSAKVASIVATLASGTFGIVGDEALDPYHPVATLLSMTTEAGDPIAYAPALQDGLHRPPADVLVTYAVDDEVMPNAATEALIRAAGLPLVGPTLESIAHVEELSAPATANLVSGRTGGAAQYAPANHSLGYNRYDTREFPPGVPFDDQDERFPALDRSFQVETPVREHADQVVSFLSGAVSGSATIETTAPPIADYDGDGVLDADDAAPWDPTSQ